MHYLGKSKKEICQILRDHQISPTSQRVEMAHLLLKRAQHLTAEDVFKLVNREFSKVSRATVYNNLNLFVEVGLLNELHITPTMKIYDSNTSHHFHFVDEGTGALTDIDPHGINDSKVIEQAQHAMKAQLGHAVQISDLQIVFKGRSNP